MLMYREDYYDKETKQKRDDGDSCGEASEWTCGEF